MSQSDQVMPAIKKKFWWWAVFTIVVYFFMRWISGGLSGSALIALEMAKTPEKVSVLLSGLDHRPYVHSTYVDFVFLIGYSFMLFYASRWFGCLSGQYILKKAGDFFSILALLAGLADLMENLGLLHTLKYSQDLWVVHSTYDMAVTKFSLLFIVVLFCGVSLFFWIIEKLQFRKY